MLVILLLCYSYYDIIHITILFILLLCYYFVTNIIHNNITILFVTGNQPGHAHANLRSLGSRGVRKQPRKEDRGSRADVPSLPSDTVAAGPRRPSPSSRLRSRCHGELAFLY